MVSIKYMDEVEAKELSLLVRFRVVEVAREKNESWATVGGIL